MTLLERLAVTTPIIQAPMAGVSTPTLAAAVSNAGGLGSIGVGATDVVGAGQMIGTLRALTARAFNVNLFVHTAPQKDTAKEAAWLEALSPLFQRYDTSPPRALRPAYSSFADNDAMLALLLDHPPPVVSFHFGLPQQKRIDALKNAGCILLSTATNLNEALAAGAAGIDAVVAQGFEAGGHRGVFDPDAADDQLGVMVLTRLLVKRSGLPVIAAGGVMDGREIRAALDLGAIAAQLGTAFIACPESAADDSYRSALLGEGARHTVMTRVISGRPARCLGNLFTQWGQATELAPPDYPIAYDAGKALNASAKAQGETGFGAQWAGQGAPFSRASPAAELLATLQAEMGDPVRPGF